MSTVQLLKIPNMLYGREAAFSALLESFERISGGHGEVLLVHGRSGAGKTSLVNELRAPIRARNGFFVSGKFNQYQQNVPYSAFQQALESLCRELQTGDPHQRSLLRGEILEAVGNNGQILIDMVPEFLPLLGPQPALEPVGPQEARHRFAQVFRDFLGVLCRPQHPMVLFIDDWQWADAGSFELLKQIRVGTSQRYLLVVAAYREDEVSVAHSLLSTVAELRVAGVPVSQLEVGSLGLDCILQMLVDTLHPAAERVEDLAQMIFARTGGNAFFVRSCLLFLHERELLWFAADRGCWQWRTGQEELPSDIVQLFVLKLHRLDPLSREIFSVAACLGNSFDVATLGMISGLGKEECLALLLSSLAGEVVRLLPEGEGACVFVHDRLQQAAYLLIPPDERPQRLLTIGKMLLERLPLREVAARVFDVANLLNAGLELLADDGERLTVFKLNIAAGRKAYAATAYDAALSYYRVARHFLSDPQFAEELWNTRHETLMDLLKDLAVSEFVAGDRAEGERCIRECVSRAASPLEGADALCILIVQYTLLARYPEAIAAGRQALLSLGITLPEDDYHAVRDRVIARVRRQLGDLPVAALADLPVMTDPAMLMACKILITMGPPCYRHYQELWGVIVALVVNITLDYGNIPQIGYSHTAFGGLVGWVDDDYATTREFGEVATRLMTETFTSPTDQSVFYLMVGSSVRHWTSHLRHASQDYRDAYEIGLRSGNLQYAAYAFGHNMYCQFYQGVPLAGLVLESRRSLEFSRMRLNWWAVDLLEGGLHLFGLIDGEEDGFDGDRSWTEERYLARVESHGNVQVSCIYRVLKACQLMLMGDCRQALHVSDEAESLIYTVGTQGLLPWPEHVFARVLITTALFGEAAEERRASWRAELERMVGKLRIWSEGSPDNFLHKYQLAAAEVARIDGRDAEAMQLYDEAIEGAEAGSFLQWAAVASERAHLFWQARGNHPLAHSYWERAYGCYACWGANAKTAVMEREYLGALAEMLPSPPPDQGEESPHLHAAAFLEKRQAQLRALAAQARQRRAQVDAVTQATELARATGQLRREIAERKRTEQALRESEQRFRRLFMKAPLGIALVDSLSGKVYEVNPMFARITGRSREDMEQLDWLRITHPDDLQEDLDNMALMNAGGSGGFQMEKRYLLPDGSHVWISMTIAPFDVNDEDRPRHLCMIEDITARKRAEREKQEFDLQLQQTQKLESLGVLAGGIAHDFNNILMVIMGNADLALMNLPPDSPVATWLHTIHSASDKAADLAKRMLAYAGRGTFQVQCVDLNRLMEEMIPMFSVSVSKKAVVSFHRADVPAVEADVAQLQQVVMNLVINASEAIGDSPGRITITTGCMECDREYLGSCWLVEGVPEGRYVFVEVADTGCGMDAETVGRMFDPFFTTKFLGRGLGMAAVLGIVRGHRGAIRVQSAVGEGTSLRVLLPASDRETEQVRFI